MNFKLIDYLWFGCIFMSIFVAGIVLGAFVFPRRIVISDRVAACEEKGGRMSLYWSEYRHIYLESCSVPEKDIDNF